MFYKNLDLPSSNPEVEFYLIRNFLNVTPEFLKSIAERLREMTFDLTDYSYLDLEKIVSETFERLTLAKREFSIEVITSAKELFRKLEEHGLTGEFLIAKLKTLDWLWEKAQNLFESLMSGLNVSLFNALLNQISSILSSLMSALGLNSDVFKECIDLMLSFAVLSNRDYQ
jgi:Zn-dependent oligopeptidase